MTDYGIKSSLLKPSLLKGKMPAFSKQDVMLIIVTLCFHSSPNTPGVSYIAMFSLVCFAFSSSMLLKFAYLIS